MSLTYMQLYNAATGDTTTRSRVMVAVSKYAHFIVGGGSTNAGRIAWARSAIADIGTATDQVMWSVVGDPAYQSAGSSIDDASLQSALEAAVNALNP